MASLGQGFEGVLISSVCSELRCFCIPVSSLSFFAKNEAIDEDPEDFETSSNLLAFNESDVMPGCLKNNWKGNNCQQIAKGSD